MGTGATVIHREPIFIRRIFIVPTLPDMVPIITMITVPDARRLIIPIPAATRIPAAMVPVTITMITIITDSKIFAPLITRGFLF
jgi:hypothetical protein